MCFVSFRLFYLVAHLAEGLGFPRALPLGAQHVHMVPYSRVLQARGDGHNIPAGGAVYPTAIYYATIQVGTPPRDFAVGIDSGSGDLFVEGKGCKGCTLASPNSQYDPGASTSSTPKGGFHHSYKTCNIKDPSATCTMYGNEFTEQVSLAGFGPVELKVGAIQSQTDNFDTKKVVGGLMGLGGFEGEDPLATLVAAGTCDNVWAICMHPGSVSNGTLTIGGVDPVLADGPIAYVKDDGFIYHAVTVASLTIGSEQIPLTKDNSAILDTGTNVLLLPPTAYAQVHSSMCADSSLSACADLWDNKCVDLTEDQVDQYPSLSFQLEGAVLEMSSRDYLLLGSPLAVSAGQYCLGIRNGGSTGFIIGDTVMRNYYLVFDYAQRRIGWGKVNKKTCGSQTMGSSSYDEVVV